MKKVTLKIRELMIRPLTRALVLATVLALVVATVLVTYNNGNRAQSLDDTTAVVRNTHWGDNVTITIGDGNFRYQANSVPNHALNAEYVMPVKARMECPVFAGMKCHIFTT